MDDERIRELFDGLGPVSIRRMFSGKGIYHNGVIFALILRGELMLKGDDEIAAEYEAAGGGTGLTSTSATAARSPCPTGPRPKARWTTPMK